MGVKVTFTRQLDKEPEEFSGAHGWSINNGWVYIYGTDPRDGGSLTLATIREADVARVDNT